MEVELHQNIVSNGVKYWFLNYSTGLLSVKYTQKKRQKWLCIKHVQKM